MRWLYHRFGAALAAQMPELCFLFGRAELTRRFADFPFDALVAELPGKAFAAAHL